MVYILADYMQLKSEGNRTPIIFRVGQAKQKSRTEFQMQTISIEVVLENQIL